MARVREGYQNGGQESRGCGGWGMYSELMGVSNPEDNSETA